MLHNFNVITFFFAGFYAMLFGALLQYVDHYVQSIEPVTQQHIIWWWLCKTICYSDYLIFIIFK